MFPASTSFFLIKLTAVRLGSDASINGGVPNDQIIVDPTANS